MSITRLSDKLTTFNTLNVNTLVFGDGTTVTSASATAERVTFLADVRSGTNGSVLACVNDRYLVSQNARNTNGTGVTPPSQQPVPLHTQYPVFKDNYLVKNPEVKILKVQTTVSSSAILLSDGTLWFTGLAAFFLLGTNNNTGIFQKVPFETGTVITDFSISTSPENIDIQNESAESYIAMSAAGKVYTWGNNSEGECGQGHFNRVPLPTRVANFDNKQAKQVHTVCSTYTPYNWTFNAYEENATRTAISIILFTDGTIHACGTNKRNVLSRPIDNYGGSGIMLPSTTAKYNTFAALRLQGNVAVSNIAKIVETNNTHNIFLLDNTSVLMGTGSNRSGQLAWSPISDFTPFARPVLTNVKKVAVSGDERESSCIAVLNDNSIKTWGSNTYGQLGVGSITTSRETPQLPLGPTGTTNVLHTDVSDVFSTTGYTSRIIHGIIKQDGSVWLVGFNEDDTGIIPLGIVNSTHLTKFTEIPHFRCNFKSVRINASNNKPSDIIVLDVFGSIYKGTLSSKVLELVF